MPFYNTKITDYGYKEKVQKYSHEIKVDTVSTVESLSRRKYADMSDLMKEKSNQRRIRYYKNKVHDVTEMALMNTDLDSMITLTFRNPVTNYDTAINEWALFIKRLQYYYAKQGISLKYIATWEFQKKRGNVFHFHCLANTGYISHEKLEMLWGNGYVFISKVGNSIQDRRKAIGYTLKYCVKEVIEQIEKNPDSRKKRFIFTSNNLSKPSVIKTMSTETIEDVIFQHMENIISDGQYSITDGTGCKVGVIDYVEFSKATKA